MKNNPRCEPIVSVIIPSIRYALAHILYEKYTLKQAQVALTLGITQAAVNKYINERCSDKIKIIGKTLEQDPTVYKIASKIIHTNTDEVNQFIDTLASELSLRPL